MLRRRTEKANYCEQVSGSRRQSTMKWYGNDVLLAVGADMRAKCHQRNEEQGNVNESRISSKLYLIYSVPIEFFEFHYRTISFVHGATCLSVWFIRMSTPSAELSVEQSIFAERASSYRTLLTIFFSRAHFHLLHSVQFTCSICQQFRMAILIVIWPTVLPNLQDFNEQCPYSLSPVSAKSQKLLRSPRKATRKISRIPFKVLDAPELQDDFYLNLVDWSSQNVLAVGLGCCVYLWSACTSQVSIVQQMLST